MEAFASLTAFFADLGGMNMMMADAPEPAEKVAQYERHVNECIADDEENLPIRTRSHLEPIHTSQRADGYTLRVHTFSKPRTSLNPDFQQVGGVYIHKLSAASNDS